MKKNYTTGAIKVPFMEDRHVHIAFKVDEIFIPGKGARKVEEIKKDTDLQEALMAQYENQRPENISSLAFDVVDPKTFKRDQDEIEKKDAQIAALQEQIAALQGNPHPEAKTEQKTEVEPSKTEEQ